MVRACKRHLLPVTPAVMQVTLPGGKVIQEQVHLCPRCRTQAAHENAAAVSRRTISTNISAYRRMGYAGEIPPELRGP